MFLVSITNTPLPRNHHMINLRRPAISGQRHIMNGPVLPLLPPTTKPEPKHPPLTP